MKMKIQSTGGRLKAVAMGAATIGALVLSTGAPFKFL